MSRNAASVTTLTLSVRFPRFEGKVPSSWLQRANASMVHHNSQLKPDVFGLSAKPLADTLNGLRLDALDRRTPASS